MTIKVTTTIQQEVEREIALPYFFKAWPIDSLYKVVDENTVICVDSFSSFKGVRVTDLSSSIKSYMEHERSEVITEQKFNEALKKTNLDLVAIAGQPFIEALKHLKEITYTACTIDGKAYGAKIDAALSFLEEHQHLLEPKPVEQPAPVLDLSDLPF